MRTDSKNNIKWKRRLGTIFSNSARSVIPLALNSFASLIVIKYSSFSLWGELVSFLIVLNLAAQLIGWGSKHYLLREFSAKPANVSTSWFENLKARLPLLIIAVLIVLLLNIRADIKTILMVWLSILFLSRSFEVLILYFKRMKSFLILEIVLSVILLGSLIYLREEIGIILILTLFAINEFIRLIVSVINFRKELKIKFTASINLKILSYEFVFFILGTIGMLQSRLDLYFVALLLPRLDLAVYQVLINYILLIQAATGFIIQPFLKEIYRMNRETLARFSLRFTFAGFAASLPITFLLVLILKNIYGISINWQMSILTFMYIIPIFYYTIRVYLLYKIKKESLILVSGISVLLLSLPLNYFLISAMGLNGALIAGVSGELLSLSFYYYFEKRVGLVGNKSKMFKHVELNQQWDSAYEK